MSRPHAYYQSYQDILGPIHVLSLKIIKEKGGGNWRRNHKKTLTEYFLWETKKKKKISL